MSTSGGTAPITFPSSDPATVKVWSSRVEREVLPKTIFGNMLQSGIVMEKTDLSRGPGDDVSFHLVGLLTGDGRIQNEKLSTPDTSNEEGTQYHTDKVVVNQLRHAVRWFGRIDKQRVVMDLRRDARDGLSDWWADRLDDAFLNQVAGNTALTDLNPADTSADGLHPALKYTGLNLPIAPSTNNAIDASGSKFDLDLAEDMITKAKTMRDENGQPVFRPVRIMGDEFFVFLLHSYSWRDLRRSADGTNGNQWGDYYKAAAAGGMLADNPIFTGSAGIYGGGIFIETSRMPGVPTDLGDGLYTANLKRACLLGKGAVALAYGQGFGGNRYSWDEDSYDLNNEQVVGAASIVGLKKCQFGPTGSEFDYAVLTADVYANADYTATP